MNDLFNLTNIILVIAVITAIIFIIKRSNISGLLNESDSALTSARYNINTLNKTIETQDQMIVNRDRTIKGLESTLSLKDESLTTSLVFVTNDKKREVVNNLKVKTITDRGGNTTLAPSIRRKIKGKWEEVPVLLVHKK